MIKLGLGIDGEDATEANQATTGDLSLLENAGENSAAVSA
jgi:hypothetical protein